MAPRGARAAAAASSGSEDGEEQAGFSRSYFLAKEKEPSSGKKRARAAAGKLSDLNLVDEQVWCRATPHSPTISSPLAARIRGYDWLIWGSLHSTLCRCCVHPFPRSPRSTRKRWRLSREATRISTATGCSS